MTSQQLRASLGTDRGYAENGWFIIHNCELRGQERLSGWRGIRGCKNIIESMFVEVFTFLEKSNFAGEF